MPKSKVQKGAERDISEQAARQVAKRKRPDRSEAMSVHTEPGDNAKYLAHSMKMWDWEKPDMGDQKAVQERIAQYFALCNEDDMKPTVSGMALAFSVNRKTLWKWVNGIDSEFVSKESRDTIKKAYSILECQMENYMQNGKINPVSGIFLMKNNMGYEDKTEMVITPQSPIGETTGQKELAADYVIDVTDQQTSEQ